MSQTKIPTVAGAMSPFPYSIRPDQTLREAREMMVENDIHHLPVTRDEDILGLISDGDVFVAGNLAPDGAAETLVESIYSRDPYVIDIHTPLEHVARQMADRRIGSAVITRHGKLAGILTHTDICRALADVLGGSDSGPDVA